MPLHYNPLAVALLTTAGRLPRCVLTITCHLSVLSTLWVLKVTRILVGLLVISLKDYCFMRSEGWLHEVIFLKARLKIGFSLLLGGHRTDSEAIHASQARPS